MPRPRRLLLFVFVFVAAPLFGARPLVPTLSVEGDDGNVALELAALDIHVTIRGHLTRTVYELTYRSSLDRDTNGEFRFPLPTGAEVSDVALYFNGKLRHAVAVERQQARKAYEETVHQGVDPALAEWSAGRNFTMRVYPIPAHGEKTVVIAYDQELTASGYTLNLRYGKAMKFDATIDPDGRALDVDGALQFGREGGVYAMHTRGKVDGIVRVAREERETALIAYSPEDKAWYASAAIDVHPANNAMPPAEQVVLLYDTSSSSAEQNDALLRRFLSAFLAKQQNAAPVDVIPFHAALEASRRVDKRDLDRTLGELQPLGATNLLAAMSQLPAIAQPLPPTARIVLVTDGISSLGDSHELTAAVAKLADLHRPLLVVNAAENGDDHVLEQIATASGGWSFDLTHLDPETAAATAMRLPVTTRLGAGFVPSILVTAGDERFAIAARAEQAVFRMPHDLPLHEVAESSMVRRAYARAKLRELMARGASDDELLAHGRAFTQLTPRTSLLVLDSWRAYELYEIPMPPDVLEEKEREEHDQLQPVSNRLDWPRGWWFITGRIVDNQKNPFPGVTVILRDGGVQRAIDVTDAEGRYSLGCATVPVKPLLVAELSGFTRIERPLGPNAATGSVIDLTMVPATVAETITVTAEAPSFQIDGIDAMEFPQSAEEAGRVVEPAEAKQSLAKTMKVIAKLRGIASTSERLRFYLAARERLGGDKAFHVFAAEAFRDRAPEIAVRILGDLAEERPDDAPLLRLLAHVLDGWNEPRLARLMLQRALELRPYEGQSWRELMVLDAKEGRAEGIAESAKRVEALKKDESADNDEELLAEIAENLARFEKQGAADIRFEPNDDITIELLWDTDWSWVDIHIAEPGGEIVKWDHTSSAAGGKFIGGYIYGYGPEIYTIRKAPAGDYRLDIDYFMSDETNVTLQTLAHVIVNVRGQRHEHFVVLQTDEEHRTLETIRMR